MTRNLDNFESDALVEDALIIQDRTATFSTRQNLFDLLHKKVLGVFSLAHERRMD